MDPPKTLSGVQQAIFVNLKRITRYETNLQVVVFHPGLQVLSCDDRAFRNRLQGLEHTGVLPSQRLPPHLLIRLPLRDPPCTHTFWLRFGTPTAYQMLTLHEQHELRNVKPVLPQQIRPAALRAAA